MTRNSKILSALYIIFWALLAITFITLLAG